MMTRYYEIRCDVPGCGRKIYIGDCDRAKARRAARRNGWRCGRKDTCERCVEKRTESVSSPTAKRNATTA